MRLMDRHDLPYVQVRQRTESIIVEIEVADNAFDVEALLQCTQNLRRAIGHVSAPALEDALGEYPLRTCIYIYIYIHALALLM